MITSLKKVMNRYYVAQLKKFMNRYSAKILVYHNILPEKSEFFDGFISTVNPTQFEKQILFLKKKYTVVSYDYFLNCLKTKMEKNLVVLSFDDGSKGVFDYALPILEKHNLHSKIFLISDCFEKNKVMWRNKIAGLINLGFSDMLSKQWGIKNSEIWSWSKNNYSEKLVQDVENAFVSAGLNEKKISDEINASFKDIKNANREIVSFGSHTCTHPILSAITQEQQRKEILNSFNFVKDLGEENIDFSVPFGAISHFNSDTVKLAKEIGYRSLLNAAGGANPKGTSFFNINRKSIIDTLTLNDFAAFVAR